MPSACRPLPLMSAQAAVATLPRCPTLAPPLLVGGAVIALLFIVIVGAIAGTSLREGSAQPSPIAIADIPPDYLIAYQRAAARYGIDWAIVAAIGKIECDHGRTELPGCNPQGTMNGAGAAGPMHLPPAASTGRE